MKNKNCILSLLSFALLVQVSSAFAASIFSYDNFHDTVIEKADIGSVQNYFDIRLSVEENEESGEAPSPRFLLTTHRTDIHSVQLFASQVAARQPLLPMLTDIPPPSVS